MGAQTTGSEKMEFHKEFSAQSIQLILQHIKERNQPISLWQNIKNSRNMVIAVLTNVNIFENIIEVYPKSGKLKAGLANHVYFYCDGQTTIFKTKVLFSSDFKISLEMPTNIFIEEHRKYNREVLRKENIQIKFKKLTESELKNKTFERQVLDYSTKGMALRIPRSEFQLFDQKEYLLIEDPPRPIHPYACISYIEPLISSQSSQGQYLRMGLEFLR